MLNHCFEVEAAVKNHRLEVLIAKKKKKTKTTTTTMISKTSLYKLLILLLPTARVVASTVVVEDRIDYSYPKMPVLQWPHKHVYVAAGSDTKVLGIGNHHDSSRPLPLGVPFEIDTPLFRGRILIRFRSTKSDDPTAHEKYFSASKKKLLMQTVVQGRFKKRLKMSDVYFGSTFPQPLAYSPPPTMSKLIDAVLRKVAPGLILDLSSDSPKVLAPLAGTVQTMSIDSLGNEPDITLQINENVVSSLGKSFGTPAKRQKILSNPKYAANYDFNTNDVYTFHSNDDTMDYGRGTMHIPVYGEYDIKTAIGNQPMSLTGIAKGGSILYDLKIFHAK